ncbi:2-succinyl-5-enolpyruvyl-6-hydroxy-3-cyclohexene-1-carboxylic-acid synthase [Leeuwenhoekiella marinoflava]|uniref:2-succinyl-5-enolpyruvyl-6-hydroxy-3-cyclohexene-1-carboxylate synthase n=2 Tax=Leeuwenhoekiella marinoflava TaxID=988 RepID=A0A4Q0PQ86_9FLAO|nr:2-succinyl-5-enolpyruvyl-6-hydroxy-3-cyclohexene-1-carboxylic-acid synthase [Leeuwenhoekiella marinoflava]RXG32780.1 2-succinyl-5-enolpyruvyl-6-hydroxy-3-cyclohexene-1-carboxylate synthase [Leeuwenhoekiella marinoflava]SHE56590.1 2-succinyl-5-enolpyruvyl-6-hydroxy-3-cyclohexene-1-carboxylate synthase [Leeuwenhoekiella marinoflava DSM 3653]
MKYSSIPIAQSVVLLCLEKGINHVVISPGSRNAPLTIGFTHHPDIHTYSVVDERSAAFFALGLAQQLQKPVAVCCTSGSAVLNYYPAVSEAFYSDIPLVIISADRPIERIDIGDGQTIRQRNVFENHILYSANLYSEYVPDTPLLDPKLIQKQREVTKHNQQEINKALNEALVGQGPVHINVPFYEPLYNTTEEKLVNPILVDQQPKAIELTDDQLVPFLSKWNKAKRKLVLIGVLHPNTIEQEFLDRLGEDPSVLVFTETTSNLHHSNFFTRTDNIIGSLDDAGFKELQPEILVTLGGMVISKKIKAFLRNYQPEEHWHIDPKKAYDTYFCLNKHFKIPVNFFWSRFLNKTQPIASNYQSDWLQVRKRRDAMHKAYTNQMTWCDFKAFDLVLKELRSDSLLQLGNSSTVRYVQLFDIDKSLKVYCNRGTSGIDGSTSTAVGAATAAQLPTTLITGDLSFFYDSNGLWNAYLPKDFKIIVINNSGGGIFRILPGDKESQAFETYFETTHQLDASHLCMMFGLSYFSAKNEEELIQAQQDFYAENSKPCLLEIKTPRLENDRVLLSYFDYIR